MSEMIERVAQAICGDDNPENILTIHRTRARAAIEAMREPTDAMKVAALSATFDEERGGDRVYARDVPIIWNAMIDEALK